MKVVVAVALSACAVVLALGILHGCGDESGRGGSASGITAEGDGSADGFEFVYGDDPGDFGLGDPEVVPAADPDVLDEKAKAWVVSTIDDGCYIAGWEPSRAAVLDSVGNLHLAYAGEGLIHVWVDAGGVHSEVIDPTATNVNYTSLGIDDQDRIYVAFTVSSATILKLARTNLAGAWSVETVSSGIVARNPNIGLSGASVPHIAYFDDVNDDLKYVYWDGASWATVLADFSGDTGRYPSISFDSGNHIHITYTDVAEGAFKHAWEQGGNLYYETIVAGAGSTFYSSVVVDDADAIHVAHYSTASDTLTYSTKPAGGAWTNSTIATGETTTITPDLVLDGSGIVHVFGSNREWYWGGSGWSVRTFAALGIEEGFAVTADGYGKGFQIAANYDNFNYIYRDAGGWHALPICAPGDFGKNPSLAIDNLGNAHVAFANTLRGSLDYLVRENGVWRKEIVVGSGVDYADVAVDSNNEPSILYHRTDNALYYTHRGATTWSTPVQVYGSGLYEPITASLTFRNTTPYASFLTTSGALRYGTGNTSSWSTYATTTSYNFFSETDLGFLSTGDTYPQIIGCTQSSYNMRLIYYSGSAWTTSVLISGICNRNSMSLTTANALRYSTARTTSPYSVYYHNGSSSQTVPGATSASSDPANALALDGLNNPYIAYYDGSTTGLRLAYHNGTSWALTTIDGDSNEGHYLDFKAYRYGPQHVVYYDADNHALKYGFNDCALVDATFSVGDVDLCMGEGVPFTDHTTGDVWAWEWSFGDGGTSTQQSPTHAYTTGGSKTVSLTARGCGWDTASQSISVTVKPLPVAGFVGSPLQVNFGEYAQFLDSSTGTFSTWHWNFGDGQTSSAPNPTHYFPECGYFTISLTVSGECGEDTETKPNYIQVINCPCIDTDGDGYGQMASTACAHPEKDCDDTNANIHPNATEICNGIDDNCVSGIDETGNALCSDGLYCTGTETCAGVSGCQAGTVPCVENANVCDGVTTCNEAQDRCDTSTAPNCDDGNTCSTDSCDPIAGCQHAPAPNTTQCRAAAGDCDVAEFCTGTDTTCPTNGYRPNSYECRASSGDCDVAETCTGSSATCPANGYRPNTYTCRASAGDCDLAELCSGSSAICPADTYRPSSYTCRASAGTCDLAETCTGSGAQCPADTFRPNTYECRASAGVCDTAETCTGSSAPCPADSFRPNTYECRASAGVCDVAEMCTGSSASCPANGYRPTSYECRAANGDCDAPEMCPGNAATCPSDVYRPNTYTCRAAAGDCDTAELCTGSSTTCPADAYRPNTYTCRASAGTCDLAETCTGSGAQCPADTFRPNTYECRASAGVCDTAETCTGSSAPCPADSFRPNTYECRASAGECDVAELCSGSSATCPSNGYRPNTYTCRTAAGDCDVAELCSGSSATCPTDGYRPNTYTCRTAAGDCDAAELCSGSSPTCPADGYRPNTYTCRASAGVCDLAETCTGTGIQCPADTFRPNTYECRIAAGTCDLAETCTGSTALCPADAFRPNTYECRASAGDCDVAEMCTGSSAICPTNGYRPNTYECRPVAGVCDVAELCSGSTATCPTDGYRPSSFTCRAAAGLCDLAETCPGNAATCPADALRPDTYECRAAAGVCDVAEDCTGSAVDCPTNAFQPSTVECRAAAGVCDLSEMCPGNAAACPANVFQPSTVECRAAAGVCDVAEDCTGSSASCPADGLRPSSYECRAAAGVCDVAEDCTGQSTECPANALRPSSYECRAATGACDVAEDCSGSSEDCPADAFAADGTECPDGVFCNGADTCEGGACTEHSGDPCDAGEECIEETDQCLPTGDDDSGDDTGPDDDAGDDDDSADDDDAGRGDSSSDEGGSCCGG